MWIACYISKIVLKLRNISALPCVGELDMILFIILSIFLMFHHFNLRLILHFTHTCTNVFVKSSVSRVSGLLCLIFSFIIEVSPAALLRLNASQGNSIKHHFGNFSIFVWTNDACCLWNGLISFLFSFVEPCYRNQNHLQFRLIHKGFLRNVFYFVFSNM